MTGRLPACVIDVGTGFVVYYYSYDLKIIYGDSLVKFVMKKNNFIVIYNIIISDGGDPDTDPPDPWPLDPDPSLILINFN